MPDTTRRLLLRATSLAAILPLVACLHIEHHIDYRHADGQLQATDRMRITAAETGAGDGGLLQQTCAELAAPGQQRHFPATATTTVDYDPATRSCNIVHGPYSIAELKDIHLAAIEAQPQFFPTLDSIVENADSYTMSASAAPGTDSEFLLELVVHQQATLICTLDAYPYPPGYNPPGTIAECMDTLPRFLLEDPQSRQIAEISISFTAAILETIRYRLTVSGTPVTSVTGMTPHDTNGNTWIFSTEFDRLFLHDPADPPQTATWTLSKSPTQ